MDLSERRDGVGRHPWEVSRARFFRRVVAEHIDLRGVRRVLDVGAGDGWFAGPLRADLPPGARVLCWDTNYTTYDLRADLPDGVTRTAAPPAGTFDVVVALDVLEHVEDDERFLAEAIVPALAPDGVAVFSAPAYERLFTQHDRALQHERRYAPRIFRALVERHLRVVASGSLFASLVPPRALGALAERLGRRPAVEGIGRWTHGRVVTWLVRTLLDADAGVGRRLTRTGVRVPGLSVWVVAMAAPPLEVAR